MKEQVSGLFAQLLAGMGYITIAPDAAYQGASGGYPRLVDRPMNRIEDLHGAADMISQYPGVDADRLGIFGICGGGGYTLAAGQTDKRFKAVATLSAFNTGLVRKNGFLDSQMNTLAERLQAAAKARALEAATGEVLYTPNMIDEKSGATEEVVKKLPFPLYRDGWYYYGKTHRHPNSSFAMTQSSLLDLVLFDASAGMGMIDQPLLMMAGDIADTFYLTEGCYLNNSPLKREGFLGTSADFSSRSF